MTAKTPGRAAGQIQAAYAKALRLQEAGKFAEAVQIHTAILKHREVAEPAFQIGRIAAMSGRKTDAATWFRRALATKPRQAEIWQALIAVLDGTEKTAAVAEARRLGVVLSERSTRQLQNAVAEVEAGRLKKAARLFAAAIEQGAEATDVRRRWAGALMQHGHAEAALRVADDAVAADADDPGLRQLRAGIREVLGDLGGAEEDLCAVLDKQPFHALAWLALMRLGTQPVEAPHVARLERLLGEAEADPDALRIMSHALAKGLEDQGRFDEAFAHLERANGMTAERFAYRLSDHHDWVRDLIASWAPRDDGFDGAAPIFVAGLPRSGTSLVETILSRHPGVAAAGEAGVMTPILKPALDAWCRSGTPYDAAALGRDYVTRLAAKLGERGRGRRSADKSILTYAYLGYVTNLLPGARIVVLDRDRRDVGLSIYKNLFRDGTHRYASDLRTIAEHIRLFDAAIAAWTRRLPGMLHVVSYEALTEDPEAQIRALLDHCGLDWDAACLSPERSDRTIATLSSAQVRQPINRGSVGGWQRFGAHLDPLIGTLRDTRFDFG